MIETNPYYACDSAVGPVFDAATWSPGKAIKMAIVCLIGGAFFSAATVYALSPGLLSDNPPELMQDLNKEIATLKQDYPWAAVAGIGMLGLIGLLGLAGSCSSMFDFFRGGYYFRAGPGGFSFRVPNGLDFSRFGLVSRVLELDISHNEISDWVIVQRKQAGALSRDAGNISAYFKITTEKGDKVEFLLDCFREPARIISRKIEDAFEMVPANFGQADSSRQAALSLPASAEGAEARFDAISTALDELLSRTDIDASVIVSDPTTSKFVQFATVDRGLLFDLPAQSLNESEMILATEYFQRLGGQLEEYQLLDTPGGRYASTQRSFQLNLADNVEAATRLTLDIFDSVYRSPSDSTLVVEEA